MRWLLASILFQSASVSFAKQAALDSGVVSVIVIITSPYYQMSLLMLACQALCWVIVLKRFPLSVAYPVSSLSLVANLVAAAVLFGERLALNHLFGIACILCGIILLYSRQEDAKT